MNCRAVSWLWHLLVIAICLGIQPAAAQDLPLDAFLGTYRGDGAIRFDLDTPTQRKAVAKKIVIGRVDKGFRIEQTFSYDDITNPEQPVERQRVVERVYRHRPEDPDGIFAHDHGLDAPSSAADPISGGRTGWAVILGRTLIVSDFQVMPDGRWTVATSAFALDDAILEQHFQQQVAGQPPQFTTGSLQQDF